MPGPTPLQTTCTTPLHEMLVDDAFGWLTCPYAELGPGQLGVGMLVWLSVFVMMANWSEGFKMPLAWTALFLTIIVPMLPGVLASRLLGIMTLAVAAGLYLLWQYWSKSQ